MQHIFEFQNITFTFEVTVQLAQYFSIARSSEISVMTSLRERKMDTQHWNTQPALRPMWCQWHTHMQLLRAADKTG